MSSTSEQMRHNIVQELLKNAGNHLAQQNGSLAPALYVRTDMKQALNR